jgi:hypothetical protein
MCEMSRIFSPPYGPTLIKVIRNAAGSEQNNVSTRQQCRTCNNVNEKQIEMNSSILQSIRGFVKRHQAKGSLPWEVKHALDAVAYAVTFDIGTT